MSESWTPNCAVCEVLNSISPVVPATSAMRGVPVCKSHLREAFQSEMSAAAKAVRRLSLEVEGPWS